MKINQIIFSDFSGENITHCEQNKNIFSELFQCIHFFTKLAQPNYI